MKKILALLCALTMTFSAALAAPVQPGEGLCGAYCYPDGSDETSAAYVYRYSYPTAAGQDEASQMINEFYAYLVDDALSFAVPMAAEEVAMNGVQAYTTITSEVTCSNDDYFSVKVTSESFLGAAASSTVSAHVFALTGEKAGTVTALPYLLEILDPGETDEWLLERQTAKADDMVRSLVWDVIQEQLADDAVAYYDDLTREVFEFCFYPEEDFYLDENGNPVFFLQEGAVAPVSEGVLYFPFTLEELLDEI